MAKVRVTRKQYDARMNTLKKLYGGVWYAPDWARREVRNMTIYDPSHKKPEQGSLGIFGRDVGLNPRVCNTGVTSG